MFGLTTTHRLRAEVAAAEAAAKAETDRIREERDAAVEDANAYKASAKTTARQFKEADEKYVDACIVNELLTTDLTKARERLAEYGGRRTVGEVLEEHDVQRKALADALGEQKRHLNWEQLIGEAGGLASSVGDLTVRLLAAEERARAAKVHADVESRPVDGAAVLTPLEARLRGELRRSEKARGALEEQCRVLQAANEVDARELRALREGAKS
jgi:hypothetical protein